MTPSDHGTCVVCGKQLPKGYSFCDKPYCRWYRHWLYHGKTDPRLKKEITVERKE